MFPQPICSGGADNSGTDHILAASTASLDLPENNMTSQPEELEVFVADDSDVSKSERTLDALLAEEKWLEEVLRQRIQVGGWTREPLLCE
jgi:hypothetical protein